MSQRIVGIAELRVSNNGSETLVAYSLGSCVGLAIYDPKAKVGGMIHYMLPDSSVDSNKAKIKPTMFADTGILLLLEEASELGLEKSQSRTVVAGAAQVMDDNGHFTIGQRNHEAAKRLLGQNHVLINAENVGGHFNRTLFLEIATGRTWIKTAGHGVQEL